MCDFFLYDVDIFVCVVCFVGGLFLIYGNWRGFGMLGFCVDGWDY